MSELLVDLSGLQSGFSASPRGTSDRTFIEQIRECKQLVMEAMNPVQAWDVPFPLPPANPMVLVHEDVKHLYQYPRGIIEADHDAMEAGVFDELPAVYYASNPWALRKMRDLVKACSAALEKPLALSTMGLPDSRERVARA